MTTERVLLADGPALQTLITGVRPLERSEREALYLANQRAARRRHDPLPAGGLFDEVARAQTDLFD